MPAIRSVDIRHRDEIYKAIEELIHRIKKELPVKSVYLYGSFATGHIHEGSDIDLVIVGDFQERFTDRIARILDMTNLPIQPLVYTPEEFDEMVQRKNPLITEVLRTGKKY